MKLEFIKSQKKGYICKNCLTPMEPDRAYLYSRLDKVVYADICKICGALQVWEEDIEDKWK